MQKKKLDGKIFAAGMKTLELAFQYTAKQEQLEVYFNKLSENFDDNTFETAVEIILETEFRFPSIAAFYKTKPDTTKSPFYGGI
jgi:hypothetical protein